jgi:hypothetical protein
MTNTSYLIWFFYTATKQNVAPCHIHQYGEDFDDGHGYGNGNHFYGYASYVFSSDFCGYGSLVEEG